MNHPDDPLQRLVVADPGLSTEVRQKLAATACDIDPTGLASLVEDTLWALSLEYAFGKHMALGYSRLIGYGRNDLLDLYATTVKEWGKQGPTVGRIMAEHLATVLLCGPDTLMPEYLEAFRVMYRKGAYTLKSPLEGLARILESGDRKAGSAYLELLHQAFSLDLSYSQSLHLTYTLPKAAGSFPVSRRTAYIRELTRIIRIDLTMVACFLEGLEKGLQFLSAESLGHFVSMSLNRYGESPEKGCRFLSLACKPALEQCEAMQIAVPLSQVVQQLTRYVRARTGMHIIIKPAPAVALPSIPGRTGGMCVFSDGNAIYLPEEMAVYGNKQENINLYKYLVKLEAGLFEFGTFDFDCEKVLDRCHAEGISEKTGRSEAGSCEDSDKPDLERFLGRFPWKRLAGDLFLIYEHGRIMRLLSRYYPGLVRKVRPALQKEVARRNCDGHGEEILSAIYSRIVLDMPPDSQARMHKSDITFVEKVIESFARQMRKNEDVETSALVVALTYDDIRERLGHRHAGHENEVEQDLLNSPFGRVIRPGVGNRTHRRCDRMAESIRVKLREKGIKVYKSDIRKKILEKSGVLSVQDIDDVIIELHPGDKDFGEIDEGGDIDLSDLDLSEYLATGDIVTDQQNVMAGDVFKYHEWDCHLGEYLQDHVRVVDRKVTGGEGDFYSITLNRHQGLIKEMRYAFELLKPEGLSILRQWIEGDHFDYRALLDFAIDCRAGRIPSDRLYIKRVKNQRDVAVLILVDLSRSTANTAARSGSTVLDIEKEAIVLFAEALDVVGDQFAIAGFSGTGRSGVDYLRIKDFSETISETVQKRINAITPMRSTRMGAAIRHAVKELENVSAKVRLLITISDGFPNDVGYKQAYAIADTRKAVFETSAASIFFKALVVNIAGDPKLDDLYGNLQYNVITDIQELPNKLLRIYSAMTRA